MDTEKTLSQTLAEALGHFANGKVNRRCVQDGGGCFYSGKWAKKDLEGCIVGRFFPEEVRIKIDEVFDGDDTDIKNIVGDWGMHEELDDIEIPQIIKDNLEVFADFQYLHDTVAFWNVHQDALCVDGKAHLKVIIKRHNLNEEDFNTILTLTHLS